MNKRHNTILEQIGKMPISSILYLYTILEMKEEKFCFSEIKERLGLKVHGGGGWTILAQHTKDREPFLVRMGAIREGNGSKTQCWKLNDNFEWEEIKEYLDLIIGSLEQGEE